LVAGLTSFMVALDFVHLLASGPSGLYEFNFPRVDCFSI
jgi:hypothetical protein